MKITQGDSQDVAFEGSGQMPAGDSCAIFFSEAADSVAQWQLDVSVRTKEGSFLVGSITTRPPTLGDPSARLVGVAHVPGAIAWNVHPSTTTPQAKADLVLASPDGDSYAPVGVSCYFGSALVQPAIAVRWWSTLGYKSKGLVTTGPSTLFECFGFNAGPATRYIQIWDAVTEPATGLAVPTIAPIPVDAGRTFSLDLPRGRSDFKLGIYFAVSTTGNLYTADAAALVSANVEFSP